MTQHEFEMYDIFVDPSGIAALIKFQQDNSNELEPRMISFGEGTLEAAEC